MNLKVKNKSKEKQYQSLPVTIKSIDKATHSLKAVFSTEDEDRHGDVVMQTGWDLSKFKENPVIINSHDYTDAAKVVGKASNVEVVDNKLQGDITFAVNENPTAKVIFDLYAEGFLHAFSVGFIPKAFNEDEKGNTDYFTISEAELLEVSAVSVPANARALAKSKGIDVDELPEDPSPTPEDDAENESGEGEEDTEDGGGEEVEESDGGENEAQEQPQNDGEGVEEQPEEEEEGSEEEETPQEEPSVEESTPQEAPEKRYIKAINHIKEEERKKLKRAESIIDSLIREKFAKRDLPDATKEKIRKRKVNQAIRSLMDVK